MIKWIGRMRASNAERSFKTFDRNKVNWKDEGF